MVTDHRQAHNVQNVFYLILVKEKKILTPFSTFSTGSVHFFGDQHTVCQLIKHSGNLQYTPRKFKI